jgi:hypothetical protein
MDPMAFPGLRSTKTTSAFSTTGAIQALDAEATGPLGSVTWNDLTIANTEAPLADAYALRVVLARRLYDDGIAMQGSPALRDLAEPTSLRVHHVDLDRLSFAGGDAVTVSGANGSFAAVFTADDTVVPGTMVVGAGTRMADGTLVQRFLIDSTSPLTQVRMTSR